MKLEKKSKKSKKSNKNEMMMAKKDMPEYKGDMADMPNQMMAKKAKGKKAK